MEWSRGWGKRTATGGNGEGIICGKVRLRRKVLVNLKKRDAKAAGIGESEIGEALTKKKLAQKGAWRCLGTGQYTKPVVFLYVEQMQPLIQTFCSDVKTLA